MTITYGTALRALEFRIETNEDGFNTERKAYVFFEHTKPENLQEVIDGKLAQIKKMVMKGIKNWDRPMVCLYGMSESYNTIEGYRYAFRYKGETEFLKWSGPKSLYETIRDEKYYEEGQYYSDKVQAAAAKKQMADFMNQIKKDMETLLGNYGKMNFDHKTFGSTSEAI